ncbi:hypothetical protein RhiirA1_470403 [Rhizophagus irregularis]|uniref:Uncharacterized protein n=1 Tax=Rhizophagus irregularis TaxID=588596 RepID=A0A2N0R687_9GLOM|nr:hypothetical protein RhiirA1_470403 [Rhizophagus irregularis]CAB4462931.1 unnamed protein product [Rhizophagus irregularis]
MQQTFLCINDEKDGKSDESISSETTSSGYDTSTSTSTFSNFSNDDYSAIDTFADHDIDWIRSSSDEYEDDDHGEFWDHHRGLLFFNIVAPFIFIIFMILLKKFFDFND